MTAWRVARAIIAAAGLFVFPQASQADMGKAPVGPKGTYIGIEGGFLFQDGPGVTGHGIVLTPGGPTHDVTVSPEDGFFVGGLIGYDNGTPYIFGFHRVEFYLLYGETDDSERDSSPPLADIVLKTVDAETLGTTGGLTGKTTVERRTWEFGFRLEDDDVVNSTTTVTWVFSPFIRNFGEDTNTLVTTATCCGGCCEFKRSADVDAWLYGFYVAAEPETWLTSNFALVARLGAGIYGFDADGKFRSSSTATAPDLFAAHVSDGDSGVGFRGLLGVGLKFKVSSSTLLEGFAEADYFSDVPTAHLSSNDPAGGYVSHVQDDDLWELRTGLRLTLGFGPPPN